MRHSAFCDVHVNANTGLHGVLITGSITGYMYIAVTPNLLAALKKCYSECN